MYFKYYIQLMVTSIALIFSLMNCSKTAAPPSPIPSVMTAIVQQKETPIYIDTIGQVISPMTIQIRPQVAGQLIAVHIQQGAIVKQGDLLYEIDPRPYITVLAQANAQLKHDQALLTYSEKTVERYKKVVEENFISLLTFEQYESNLQAAKAQIEVDQAAVANAQLNLDYCHIVAPVSGKISSFVVDVGNIVSAYDINAITSLHPFDPIDILFSLSQSQFELIRKEQGNEGTWSYLATLPEHPQLILEGQTYFIDDKLDQNTGTISLKGRLPNPSYALWPGEFVKIKVLHKKFTNALLAPPGAILTGKAGTYVYLVDANHKVTNHAITILTKTEEYTAFTSETVKAGDQIVINGQLNLAPDMVVKVIPDSPSSKSNEPKLLP